MAARESFPCPVCGEEVPPSAKACPACGSDEKTGWSDHTVYDDTDIPDESEFDYRDFLEKERLATQRRTPKKAALLVVTLLVIAAFAWLYVVGW